MRMRGRLWRSMLALALAAGSAAAAAEPAKAQYDRDGRYVPSPNGIPADPTARPIPMYSGTPGEAIGTPALPRAPVLTLPPLSSPPPTGAGRVPITTGRVPLTAARCRHEWSPAFGVGRSEFVRRCAKVLRHTAPAS